MTEPYNDSGVIQVTYAEAKAAVKRKEDLDSLVEDPRFQKLIMKGYFEAEATRLVLLKADPSVQSKEHQDSLTKSIDAIGTFNQYLRSINNIGLTAQKTLENVSNMEQEIAEEAEVA